MRILTIYNEDLGVEVKYKTDLINDAQDNFTVMEINGLDDAEKKMGFKFTLIPYKVSEFVAFCELHGFGLSEQNVGRPGIEPSRELVPPTPSPTGS